jgi:WD repeat-containing protein 24
MYGYDNPINRQVRGGINVSNRINTCLRPPQESQTTSQHQNILSQQRQQQEPKEDDVVPSEEKNRNYVVAVLNQPKFQMPSASQMQEKNPYTAISISPCRNYAVTASKDTMQIIRISPKGIRVIESINMAQYFQMTSSSSSTVSSVVGGSSMTRKSNVGTIMDSSLFSRVDTSPSQVSSSVNITDVAWSIVPVQVASRNSSTTSEYHPNSPRHYADNKEEFNDWKSDHDVDDWVVDEYDQKAKESVRRAARDTGHTRRAHSASSVKSSVNPIGSFIAAAGSNGSIVIWNAETLLHTLVSSQNGGISISAESQSTTRLGDETNQQQQQHLVTPEAVVNHHSRDVSRLAWHPNKYGLLLSGSQDGSVRLWERRLQEFSTDPAHEVVATKVQQPTSSRSVGVSSNTAMFSSFFAGIRTTVPRTTPIPTDGATSINNVTVAKKPAYQWHSRATYEPKSEAVRDIRWSLYYDDGMLIVYDCKRSFRNHSLTLLPPPHLNSPLFIPVFALVTRSGSLIAYNQWIAGRALLKFSAHSGEATALDWHPLRPTIIATGGGSVDRCVKIWDLEIYLTYMKDDSNISTNANTLSSRGESVLSDASGNDNY